MLRLASWLLLTHCAFSLQLASSPRRRVQPVRSTVSESVVVEVEGIVAKSNRPPPVLELPGDTLIESTEQRMIVLGTTALTLATSLQAASQLTALSTIFVLASALIFADFLTGIFHWGTDNYGSLETPLVGQACAAFQGHHRAPWTITYRSTANNVFKIAKIVAPLILLASILAPPALALFFIAALYSQILSQEFHKYSHMLPREQPDHIRFLQRYGLAISTADHGRHHAAPYDGHYTIFTGILNPLLDRTLFFRRLEVFIYRNYGLEPNCWNEGDKGKRIRELALSL